MRKTQLAMNGSVSVDEIPRLPSQDAVINMYLGEPGGVSQVIWSTLGRALIVSPGIYLSGQRGTQLIKASIGAALAIETFVICWTFLGRKRS